MERIVRIALLVILGMMCFVITATGIATLGYFNRVQIIYLPKATEVFPVALLVAPDRQLFPTADTASDASTTVVQ